MRREIRHIQMLSAPATTAPATLGHIGIVRPPISTSTPPMTRVTWASETSAKIKPAMRNTRRSLTSFIILKTPADFIKNPAKTPDPKG
jgi:hypothetical protein